MKAATKEQIEDCVELVRGEIYNDRYGGDYDGAVAALDALIALIDQEQATIEKLQDSVEWWRDKYCASRREIVRLRAALEEVRAKSEDEGYDIACAALAESEDNG